MPRLTYLTGVALALVGGVLALTHELLEPWPGVNERNVRRIKEGMTLQEVEAILGGPANRRLFIGGMTDRTRWHTWQGADAHAEVAFGRPHPSPDAAGMSARFPRPGRGGEVGTPGRRTLPRRAGAGEPTPAGVLRW